MTAHEKLEVTKGHQLELIGKRVDMEGKAEDFGWMLGDGDEPGKEEAFGLGWFEREG